MSPLHLSTGREQPDQRFTLLRADLPVFENTFSSVPNRVGRSRVLTIERSEPLSPVSGTLTL